MLRLRQHAGAPNRARVPIRTRVNLAFALAVGVLLAIAAASYLSVTSLAETGQWIGHTHEVLAAIDAVAATATTAEAGTRGYALTGEERFLEAYQSGARAWTRGRHPPAADRRQFREQRRVDRLEPLSASTWRGWPTRWRSAATRAPRRRTGAGREQARAVESIQAASRSCAARSGRSCRAGRREREPAARTRWIIVIGASRWSWSPWCRACSSRARSSGGARSTARCAPPRRAYRLLVDRNLAAIAAPAGTARCFECNEPWSASSAARRGRKCSA